MISDDGSYFCSCAIEGTSHERIFCSKLTPGQRITKQLNLTAIINEPNIAVTPIIIFGHQLYVVLNKDAPNKYVVAVDLNNPNQVSHNCSIYD